MYGDLLEFRASFFSQEVAAWFETVFKKTLSSAKLCITNKAAEDIVVSKEWSGYTGSIPSPVSVTTPIIIITFDSLQLQRQKCWVHISP